MFETTTVTFEGKTIKSPEVALSYTKLKSFKACPKRHFHYDVVKDVAQEADGKLEYGLDVHKAMAKRIEDGTPLPAQLADYEKWVQLFIKGQGQPGVRILVEQQYAIDREFKPVHWFKGRVWWRSIADAVKIVGPLAVNWDWKTGKPPSMRGQKDDPLQILTAAACIFHHYPEVQAIRNEFIWLEHDARTRAENLTRKQLPELWASVMPMAEEYQEAHRTRTFPPKKNGLCRQYCGVTSCEYHGG